MKSYRIKACHSCRNCKHVFAVSRQDDPTSLYCNFDKTVPKFNADKNNYWPRKNVSEELRKKTENLVYNRMQKWDDWAKIHVVDFCGFCNNHSLREENVQKI